MLTTDPLVLALGTLFLGIVLGVVFYRGDYCMVAMLRDFYLIRDTTLLRSFVIYFLFASALFHLGGLTGLLAFLPPPTLHPPSLPTLVGGVLFGVGMVLGLVGAASQQNPLVVNLISMPISFLVSAGMIKCPRHARCLRHDL